MAYESPARQVYVRLDDATLARIDRFAEHLAAEQPGLKLTRSDAMRVLIYRALDQLEAEGRLEEPRGEN